MAMLEVRGVHKTFFPGTPDEVRALRGLDLTIEPGTFVVVIGTNGSGKSTTLNAVAGTFPVDAGTIRLAGRDITRWAEHRRARLIGRVFQDPLAGTSPGLSICGAVMGSLLFRLMVALALRWGLDPNDLKLITAAFVFAALVLPKAFANRLPARAARST